MEEVEIWRSAQVLVEHYGDAAEMAAAQRADKALVQGDYLGFEVWKQIASAAKELGRQKPKEGESFH